MNTVRALLLCALAAVGACHRASDAPAPAAPKSQASVPVAVKKGPTAAQLTAGMVEAAGQGKSQLAVDMKFDLQQRPAIGQALDVDIAVVPQIDASAGDIRVTGGDGLTVAAADPIILPAVEAGEVYRRSVKVTPTATGVLMLSLTVSLKHDEMTDSRVFSIPLIVDR
jgi:hypothetical protein